MHRDLKQYGQLGYDEAAQMIAANGFGQTRDCFNEEVAPLGRKREYYTPARWAYIRGFFRRLMQDA